jgi:hypothetical protein
MYRQLSIFGRVEKTALAVVLLSLCLSGCGMLYRQHHITLKKSDFAPLVLELAATNTEFFDNPFTLVVMLDRRPCGKMLSESVYWSDWQRHMIEAGNGFVFATSRADSAGLVYAAHLDSVDAPVLVLESYEQRIPRLTNWRAYAPFHLLTDSTGALLGVWLPAFDRGESAQMIYAIDSLIADRQ